MLITKKMDASFAAGYDFSFSRNTLKYGVVMKLELNMMLLSRQPSPRLTNRAVSYKRPNVKLRS